MRAKYFVLIYLTTILKVTKIILKITLVKRVVETDPQDENTVFFRGGGGGAEAEGNCFS